MTALKDPAKKVLIYGDSNAWGWIFVEQIFPSQRMPKMDRWCHVLEQEFAGNVEIINASLPGRTAGTDDGTLGLPAVCANGLAQLPTTLASHMPLDLVVIALGSNDFKEPFGLSVLDIALNILKLGAEVRRNTGVATTYSPAEVLILAPPPLGAVSQEDWVREVFSQNSIDKSNELAGVLGPLAKAAGFAFFDVGRVISTSGPDGIHFSARDHKTLGTALVPVIKGLV